MKRIAALVSLIAALGVSAGVVHSERSLYQNILVVDQDNQRCLQFTVRRDPRNQTCMDLEHPKHMVFEYTQMMMASLLLGPPPKRILMIGLGGGTLPSALAEVLPDAKIDVVEIDPGVVDVAKTYFDYVPSPNTRLYVQDARVYGKRAGIAGTTYDLVMLDAYNGEYIPEHLMTHEYLEETRHLLTKGGVLAANTFAISRLYHHESVTFEAVYGRFFNFRVAESANRIVLAVNGELPTKETMRERATKWAPLLKPFDVPVDTYPDKLTTERDWNTAVRQLTDQYSPANLLRAQD